MNTTDKSTKVNLAADPKWQELYVLSEHWQSDLEFYKDDLRFLHHLVDKYMIWITKSENLEMVREIMLSVFELQKRCTELISEVATHKHNLASLEKDATEELWEKVKTGHGEMEMAIYNFVKEFRANRKEVFRITEYIVDSEELSNLLKA
ncbi:MAG: hypothetical protein WBM43_12990 [Flavobacteriaceae bacterium]